MNPDKRRSIGVVCVNRMFGRRVLMLPVFIRVSNSTRGQRTGLVTVQNIETQIRRDMHYRRVHPREKPPSPQSQIHPAPAPNYSAAIALTPDRPRAIRSTIRAAIRQASPLATNAGT